MLFVIMLLVSCLTFVLLLQTRSFAVALRHSLMPLVSLGILPVIFVVFVLANMMIRPELFPDMKFSGLLRMVLIFLNRKRRKMIEKIGCLFKGLLSHFFSGCSICARFSKHIAKTVVQILKGGDSNQEP